MDDIDYAAAHLLQYIQDAENVSPDGFVQQLGLLEPEIRHGLFSTDNGVGQSETGKELLPAACETGDLDTVVWLLFLGADPCLQTQKGSSLEIASFYGHIEIVNKLISWNEDALRSRDVIVGCLLKACEGQQQDLIKFWLGHLNNLCLDKEPWAHFVTNNGLLPNGYAMRVPAHHIQQLPAAVIQVMGDAVQYILEVWASTDDDDEGSDNKLYARWNNRSLSHFDEGWFQRPRYNENLVHIDLSQNALQAIPEKLLWGIPSLQYLDVSDNLIAELPDAGHIDPEQCSLVYLKAINNGLLAVSNDVFMMPRLQVLSLARTKLNVLALPNWKVDNEQPEWKCINLKELNVSFNDLSRLPEGLSVTSRLKRLEVSNNKLTEMKEPWHCPMEILDLSHNQISEMPDIDVYWRQSLRILNLASNNLGKIPQTILKLTMLENLNLSNTNIRELPAKDMWKTFSLAKLDLSANHLCHIVVPVLHYDTLLNWEEEEEQPTLLFPDYFCSILKALNLSHNDLHEVPTSVCQMRHLKHLAIHGNPRITHLPDRMALLQDLAKLTFNTSRITQPPEVYRLLQQRSKRPVKKAGSLLPIIQALRKRFLKHQQCRDMKLVLVGPSQSGKTELLCSLTGCEWPEEDVGVNVISKTSLNMKEDIHFTIWDLKGSDDFLVIHQAFLTPHAIFLLVWDITQRTDENLKRLEPHVLNIKARAPLSRIIAVGTHIDRYRSNRKQVESEAAQAFERNFPDTEFTFVQVDARPATSQGIRDLKQMIHDHAITMTNGPQRHQMLGREIPGLFMYLKKHLMKQRVVIRKEIDEQSDMQGNGKPYITEAELAATIQQMPGNFIETKKDVEQVVEYLQDCGALIHIQDYTYKLTRLYFLDPVWLSNTLVKVVRLKNNDYTVNQGIVTESQLQQLSKDSGFKEGNFKEYLELLARFEIVLSTIKSCPETSDEPRKFIIPSALPHGRPWIENIGEKPYKNKLMRWYHMAYTPPGFWSRLVARLLVSIKQQDLNEFRIQLEHILPCVSQEGLFIRHDAGEIKIEPMKIFNDPGLRIILLSKDNVFSPLGFIVDHIEKLIKEWYPGLTKNRLDGTPRVVRYIPCPVCVQNFQTNVSEECRQQFAEDQRYHLFTLEEVIRATCSNVDKSIVCPKHPDDDTIPLSTLAPDLFLTDLAVDHLNEAELTVGEVRIGKGSFGEVYKAQYRGNHVAFKTLLRRRLQNEEEMQDDAHLPDTRSTNSSHSGSRTHTALISVMSAFPRLRYEVRMMAKLSHPCVLELIGVSVQRLAFAMELAPSGDLASYLHDVYKQRIHEFVAAEVVHESILPRKLSVKIAFQVASCISYLHNAGVIHADIKTNNVLLFSTDIQSPINIKMADYGISHEMDLAGVRGDVGRNEFCAPEIIQGLAFDEKVDWFSYAMFLYHLMSGTTPFQHTTYLATVSQVTAGSRPDFKYFNYSMRPQLPRMEYLMKDCWRVNPDERPSGKDVLDDMQDPSFMCLRRVVEFESDVASVVYTQCNDQKKAEVQNHVFIWHHDGRVIDHDMNTGDPGTVIKIADQQEIIQVVCACAFDRTNVVGTSMQTLLTYNLVADKLIHRNQITLPAVPCTICYIKHSEKTPSTLIPRLTPDHKYGILFVGMKESQVNIYTHQTPIDDPISIWILRKKLLLSVQLAPCHCISPADDRDEIWISCGDTLRVFNLSDGLLDPLPIPVQSDDGGDKEIAGLCYRNGSFCCFLRNSRHIMRYDAASRALITTLYCGDNRQRPGDKLFGLVEAPNELQESGDSSSSQGVAEAANDDRENREYAKVTSILIVEDTIWVGRSQGGILAVYVGKDEGKVGDVLGVFRAHIATNGPTIQLLPIGHYRVVECQSVAIPDIPFRHRLISWEKWGRQAIEEANALTFISRLEDTQ